MDDNRAPMPRTTSSIGVSSPVGQPDPLLDSLTKEALGQARAQLLSLEEGLGQREAPSRAAHLMDETYRAAHGLRMAVDPDRFPRVQRLAQLLQGVVQAVRSGRLFMGPELAVLLATVMRITRESLDLASAGGAAPAAAESAIEALQEILARPDSWEPPPSLGRAPPPFTHVDTRRLRSAGDAARHAARAGESFQRAAVDACSIVERFREVMRKQESAARDLREAIPRGLAAAARGEPVTEITSGLVAGIAELGRIAEGLENDLDRFPKEMRDAASEGARAAELAASAVRQLECVRVASLLEGVPDRVKRSVKRLGVAARVVISVGDSEIDTLHADLLRTAVGAGIRALTIPAPFTGKRLAAYSVEREAELALRAHEEKGRLNLRLSWTGDRPEEDHVRGVISTVQRHLKEAGGGIDVDCGARGGADMLLSLPLPRLPARPTGEYVVVRAGGGAYAIPARDVVEFLAGDQVPSRHPRSVKGAEPLRLAASGDPTAGVLVHAGSEDIVILVDEIEGREMLAQGAAGLGGAAPGDSTAMGIRTNGEAIPIVDASALVRKKAPRRHAGGKPRSSRVKRGKGHA